MRTSFKLTITLLLALAAALQAQDKLAFSLNFEPRTGYLSTINMNQTITQTVDGEEQTLEQNMLMAWKYDVLSKGKSGETSVELTYQRVMVKQSYGTQVTEYDSEDPPTYLDPSMKGLAVLPGSRLQVRFDSRGGVQDIKGINEMIDKMIKALDLPDSPQKEKVIDDLRRQFGRDAMEQSLEQVTAFYPSKPVSIGESWSSDQNITTGLPMRISSTYTLKSRDGGNATIDVASRITSDSSSNTISMGLLSMAYHITGGQDGAIVVDELTGLPLRSELDLHFSGTVNVSGVPDQEPQAWPISAEGSVVVTFQKQ